MVGFIQNLPSVSG